MISNIQIVTKEWIDIIYLHKENNIAKRKSSNDKGSFEIIDNIMKIYWDKWGEEEFKEINGIYYNLSLEIFEIYLENNFWNDNCYFNIFTNGVCKKSNNDIGKYHFENNDLIITWEKVGIERFYQLCYGKIYSNTYFAHMIKNSPKKEIKTLAIVFPQFHNVKENNEFWGDGFTEWTLLSKMPYTVNDEVIRQPHNDIGYFDLTDYNHRKYMRVLADKYNIFGFCYYHYWFKNKKVMFEPTELMLKDGEPNKPFLFCWANEQWTKRWDGGNNEILLEQDYSDLNGNIEHFYYLLPFFKHNNYIKKYNMPIFIFYRIEEEHIEDIRSIIKLWNEMAIKEGFSGIYFMKFLGPFNNSIFMDEISGYAEFEPGYCTQSNYNKICIPDNKSIFDEFNGEYNEDAFLNKNQDVVDAIKKGTIKSGYEYYVNLDENQKKIKTSPFFVYDGNKLYENTLSLPRVHKDQHRGISLNWNNAPRRNFINKKYSKYPHYYKNITSNSFGKTFKDLLKKVNADPNNGDDFIFISAWNEWNEQAILEPNNEDGYTFLTTLSNTYLEYYNNPKKKCILNICHKGGGTEKYMTDLKKLFPEYHFIDFINFEYNIDYDILYNNIGRVHINSILHNNLKDNYHYFFNNFFKNVEKYITIHDYQWLFNNDPNILKDDFEKLSPINIEFFDNILSLCSKIIFPSKNIYDNYSKYIDLSKYYDKIHITWHNDKLINNNYVFVPEINNMQINIAFVGNFVDYKGSELFKYFVNKFTSYKDYIIIYHIYGYIDSNNNDVYNNLNIRIHNSYKDDNIIFMLHNDSVHGILHLSQFEESYCYALTNSINSGLPIIYLDRGAFKERLGVKDKYFGGDIGIIEEVYMKALDYIILNKGSSYYYETNNNIQPTRWYLENY